MQRFLLTLLLLLPLVFLAPGVSAQSYTYDCICLYSDARGTCVEYTCDAYRRSSRYDDGYCDGRRYDRYCDSYSNNNDYNSVYRSSYYNSSYYDSRYNDDWYYRRYTGRSGYYNRRSSYDRTYYDTPYYY